MFDDLNNALSYLKAGAYLENPLKGKFCHNPFRNFEVNSSGEVYSCCWTSPEGKRYPERYSLGNLNEQSAEEIWNGSAALELRKSILDQSFRFCSREACPVLKNDGIGLMNVADPKSYYWDPFFGISEMERHNIQNNDSITHEGPSKVYLNVGKVCNYRCPTCAPPQVEGAPITPKQEFESDSSEASDLLGKMKGTIKTAKYIFLGSMGEPLYNRATVQWLQRTTVDEISASLFIEIQTNASLFNQSFWSSLPIHIQERITMIQVSLDAATKQTYEQVRLGGKWDNVVTNLEFISRLPRLRSLTLNFVVQSRNFKEMKLFVELGTRLNARVRFTQLQKWPALSDAKFKSFNVCDPKHEGHRELLDLLADPAFKMQHVDMGEFLELAPNLNSNWIGHYNQT